MRLTIRSAVLSAVILSGAAGAALAQPPAPNDHRGDQRGRGPMAAQMQAIREARERQRAQDLRTILRLRPEQEPALTAYLASMKPPAPMAGPGRGAPPADGAPMTTPQRLDEMARRDADRAAMRQRRDGAVRTFYAALTGEQRQVFDALQRMRHGGRGGGWGRGDGDRPGFGGPRGFRGGGPRED